MLHSLKDLYGCQLGASDGGIGHVKDFYFDDRTWAVRYVVVDTGSWLPWRQVLLAPHAFGSLHLTKNALCVNLTRKQIEESPLIESHKPVSRQYEEQYYQYYGWPYYWEGTESWGMSGLPISGLPALPPAPAPASGPQPKRADAHLRCMQAVNGYYIKASDGTIGHVCDFILDANSWTIRQLVVKTGHLFSGVEVEIPTSKVDRISYDESTVYVKMTREDVELSPIRYHTSDSAAG